MMLRLGYCVECSASYPSPVVTDGLCPICQAHERPNDPTPIDDYDNTHERPWSRRAMQERLSISGDADE